MRDVNTYQQMKSMSEEGFLRQQEERTPSVPIYLESKKEKYISRRGRSVSGSVVKVEKFRFSVYACSSTTVTTSEMGFLAAIHTKMQTAETEHLSAYPEKGQTRKGGERTCASPMPSSIISRDL